MRIAADTSHGFYGLLARAVFGEEPDFNWYERGLEDGLLEAAWPFPGTWRALALAQVGRYEQAEREIRKLGARARADLCLALVALANALDLPAAEMRVAQRLKLADGHHHHGALFPLPSWEPADGFRLDRALIYAVARAESGFDTAAESGAGARGLMQLMPVTVAEAAEKLGQEPPDGDELLEPPVNLALGQAYLDRLLDGGLVGGNLFYMAAAYNCGPTCLARWRRSLAIEDDPLLFLEALPSEQTRAYVKKVMLNLWTYRARLGQPIPSLRDLAENRWPMYRALDSDASFHARN
jgi:soluble lytic murein transglycosylase